MGDREHSQCISCIYRYNTFIVTRHSQSRTNHYASPFRVQSHRKYNAYYKHNVLPCSYNPPSFRIESAALFNAPEDRSIKAEMFFQNKLYLSEETK